MSNLYFDVETVPLPVSKLIKPEFVANKTLKDPEKISADLAAKEKSWRETLALDAATGSIAMVGFMDKIAEIFDGDEKAILVAAWKRIDLHLAGGGQVVGFNCAAFDYPFLIRRSWALGVVVPPTIRKGRYWADGIIDLMDVWSCGKREQTISLANLCRFLGVGEKTGSGADFGKLSLEQQHAYLKKDLELTKACAERLLG
jgi:hypothetical protein